MRALGRTAAVSGIVLGAAVFLAGQAVAIDRPIVLKLMALPRATHHSEIRADYDATREMTRVWINTNEDDTRLWSRQGGQLDMEFRVSAWVTGRADGRLPATVALDFATLGELRPADPPHALELRADGRVVPLTQVAEPEARSGALVFLSTKTTIAVDEFARLVVAGRVEGRIWGREFALVDTQLEILRAYLVRLAGLVSP